MVGEHSYGEGENDASERGHCGDKADHEITRPEGLGEKRENRVFRDCGGEDSEDAKDERDRTSSRVAQSFVSFRHGVYPREFCWKIVRFQITY